MVFQHRRHVRQFPAPKPRGSIQSILLASSQLLGAAGNCTLFTTRKAEERFQGASWSSYRDAGSDLVELSLSFHVYGLGGLHHARYQRLLPCRKLILCLPHVLTFLLCLPSLSPDLLFNRPLKPSITYPPPSSSLTSPSSWLSGSIFGTTSTSSSSTPSSPPSAPSAHSSSIGTRSSTSAGSRSTSLSACLRAYSL